jgi:glycosyltransferase involved in cell wall biosynthesis
MILDSSFPPDPRVENEALSLIRVGHEVFLFSLDFKGRSGIEEYNGIYVVRYPAGKALHKLSALVYTFPFYTWIVSSLITHFVKTYNIQTLHIHDMVIAEAVFHANHYFELPIVLDFHENRPEIMKHYKHVNNFSGRMLINLKRWSAKYYELASKAQHVIVVTEAAKTDILEKTGKDSRFVTVVSNSVNPDEFLNYPVQPDVVERMQGSFNLLYIGDTSLRRGIDTAILSVSMVRERIPNVKLWLVGKSSADNDLKSLAKELKVEKHIEFEGWQYPSTFPSYLQSTHVGLSPLKRNIHHDTTYANKLFQYMACGKPILVSDCTAQADLITAEHCGLVHKADDPGDLADKIYYLYVNANEVAAMGERGKKALQEKWKWDLRVQHLLDMYSDLKL